MVPPRLPPTVHRICRARDCHQDLFLHHKDKGPRCRYSGSRSPFRPCSHPGIIRSSSFFYRTMEYGMDLRHGLVSTKSQKTRTKLERQTAASDCRLGLDILFSFGLSDVLCGACFPELVWGVPHSLIRPSPIVLYIDLFLPSWPIPSLNPDTPETSPSHAACSPTAKLGLSFLYPTTGRPHCFISKYITIAFLLASVSINNPSYFFHSQFFFLLVKGENGCSGSLAPDYFIFVS